ncbi:hypothetical protein [Acinetobacter indicus]|uniref:hypothetical protein n=1 Tax=Acinetobacter indicus TaxID=756892 RepID=UPI001444344E|nr:hypothetical protein [Acinetobacter indicus]
MTKEIEWSNLSGVFLDFNLAREFEKLEEKYLVVNKSNSFANLVNMSTANKQPFHRWIKYREGYAGQLVMDILKRYPINKEKQFMMDPMCGSGSSLLAALSQDIDGLGLDVNGYAILASNMKGRIYTLEEIEKIEYFIKLLCKDSFEIKEFYDFDLDGIAKYFPEENFKLLLSIKEWINIKIKNDLIKNLFNLALYAILEDCSNRKKDGNGLATRPTKINNPKARMISQLEMMLEDIKGSLEKRSSFIEALDCSALTMDEGINHMKAQTGKSLGTIIFSPPYANSFDYFESYKLELIFGEYTTVNDLKTARERLIRNYRITKPKQLNFRYALVEQLCEEINHKIPLKEAQTGSRDSRSRLVPNMLRAYFEDMYIVCKKAYEQLDYDGTMHIVVDQSSYLGIPIATDLLLAKICEDIGFEVKEIIECRKAKTSGQQLKSYPHLKNLLRESIISVIKH